MILGAKDRRGFSGCSIMRRLMKDRDKARYRYDKRVFSISPDLSEAQDRKKPEHGLCSAAVESSDEHATAHLIAERTLALAGAPESSEAGQRTRGYVLLAIVAIFVAAVGGALIFFHPFSHPAQPDRAAGVGGPMDPLAGSSDAADSGFLNCNAWPSARVYLDGRRGRFLGNTPLSRAHVPPGIHMLVFVSRDGSLRKEVSVTVEKGETRTLAVSLER